MGMVGLILMISSNLNDSVQNHTQTISIVVNDVEEKSIYKEVIEWVLHCKPSVSSSSQASQLHRSLCTALQAVCVEQVCLQQQLGVTLFI